MAVTGGLAKADGKDYPGNMTIFVFLTCLMASFGGLIFGYDIGISGGMMSMDPFLIRFFPSVYAKEQEVVDTNQYCKFDSALLLTFFTLSLYLAAVVASLFTFVITRKLGRRATMLSGDVVFLAGAIPNGFAMNIAMLIIGRILLGVATLLSQTLSPKACNGNNSYYLARK